MGQNEQRITILEKSSPEWIELKIDNAKMQERVKIMDIRQLRMENKIDEIFKAIREQK